MLPRIIYDENTICNDALFYKLIKTFIEKKEEIWLSPMTKTPTPAEMPKGQSDNTNNAKRSSITQRLRTDLGRSVGVTQLVWLTWFTGPPSHSPQQPCNQKDTRLKICK